MSLLLSLAPVYSQLHLADREIYLLTVALASARLLLFFYSFGILLQAVASHR